MSAVILIVEDDLAVQELITTTLSMAGHRVIRSDSAEAALHRLRTVLPDLLLIDWMLPGQSGLQLLRGLRADTHAKLLPMIMLTARDGEHDAVMALECGADDYIVKPFSPRELVARIHAVLRRRLPHKVSDAITIGRLRIDPTTHRVTVADHEIFLSPTEFRLLHFLMSQPGRVHNRAQLLDQVWNVNTYLEERTVDAYVGRLRNILEAVGCHESIETVRGLGYRFVEHPGGRTAPLQADGPALLP